MKKKLAVLFMTVCLIVSNFGIINVSAATYGDLTYTVSNGEVTITDCNESATGEIVIPSEIDGYPVTSIGDNAFEMCVEIENVEIPDSVVNIGNCAFALCWDLKSVAIPDGVRSIREHTFRECFNLTNVTIPDSVTKIEDYAFEYCSKLQNITFPESVTSIGGYAFSSCSGLSSIIIPCGVTEICWYAFSGCLSLSSIEIPESVIKIGDYAFSGCDNLVNITIPDNRIHIGMDAFYGTAYYNDSLNWDDNVLYINNHLIAVKEPISREYTIRENTITIADYAFSNCSSLSSITIPESVVSIGDWAFCGCSLTSITIPNAVTYIGGEAFIGCSGLTNVIIGNGVLNIGMEAFMDCPSLTSVTIGNSVKSIGWAAFWCCTNLKSVTIPKSVTDIGHQAFDGCEALTTVYYNGNEQDWQKISIDSDNEPLINATKNYFYYVTFTDENGNEISKIMNDIDTPISETDIPLKDGFTTKLYTDKACTQEFDITTPITENTQLYAVYEGECTLETVDGEDTAKVKVGYEKPVTGKAIIVVYDEHGRLIGIHMMDVTSETEFEIRAKYKGKAHKIKVFIWDEVGKKNVAKVRPKSHKAHK